MTENKPCNTCGGVGEYYLAGVFNPIICPCVRRQLAARTEELRLLRDACKPFVNRTDLVVPSYYGDGATIWGGFTAGDWRRLAEAYGKAE